jgi:uncharacterized membrane protein YbhN (UPF0104 family)
MQQIVDERPPTASLPSPDGSTTDYGQAHELDASAEPASQTWSRLLPRMAAGLVLGVLVLSGLALFGDVQELGAALRDFDWWLIVPVLLLTCFNYGLRFAKWEIYLRRLDLPRPPLGDSFLVYLSAFSMSVTPGKVGEVIKAILLRRQTGAPVARTTAVIAAERLTDGLAMLALAGIGLLEFGYGRTLLGVATVAALLVVVLLQRPGFSAWAMANGKRLPLIGDKAGHAHGFFDASNVLFRPRLVAVTVALGVVSWAGECVAFFLVLTGLGLKPDPHLLLVATFVLAVSSIFGAVSMLPGGLIVAEASVAGLLLLLLPSDEISRGTAAAATLLIRFATLWFAVFLGFAALALISARQARAGRLDTAAPTANFAAQPFEPERSG